MLRRELFQLKDIEKVRPSSRFRNKKRIHSFSKPTSVVIILEKMTVKMFINGDASGDHVVDDDNNDFDYGDFADAGKDA